MAEKGNAQSQVKEIIKQLEDGMQELFTTEKYAEYLRVMSRFPKYSPRNVQLIQMQMPDASLVAGYQTWQTKFGRFVKRGETGIRILAPTPFTVKKEKQKLDPDTKQPILGGDGLPLTEIVEERIPRFKVIPVFDVSQTDGKPLPELAEELPGDVRHYELFMEALELVSPLPLVMGAMEGKDGYCRYGEKVAVREGMGEMQTVCAAVHEIGHAKLHDPTQMPEKEQKALEKKSKRTKEVEAESVSYVVCQYYGIETSPNSFGYIASWSKDMELRELNASLGTIRKTSAELIEAIDAKFRELAKERGIDLTDGREESETQPQAAEKSPEPEYDEQTAQTAFNRLKANDLVYMSNAEKPLQLVEVREDDILFYASSLDVELPRTHEQVLDALRLNPKNRHLLELAAAELNPPEAAREEPELKPNQHIETIDGVEFVVTTPGIRQPEQAAAPEKEYDLGFGHLGNGLSVWNRLEERDGDYVLVAHIGPDRSVKIFDDVMPESVRAQIDNIARTAVMNISATQDTPVFDTPPETHEPEQIAPAPMETETPVSSEILPDPAIGHSERDLYGYTQPDMLPATMERALELYDQDLTVYMLHPDGTEAMAFDRAELEGHDGIFGIETAEWQECPEYRRKAALQSETAREAALLEGEGDAYGVYQLKGGDELHYHRSTGLEQLHAEGNAVDRANYTLVYTAPLEPDTILDDLYIFHNEESRPAGQEMWAMSTSDVVVLRRDGEITSHYVDNNISGFTELPSFLGVENFSVKGMNVFSPAQTEYADVIVFKDGDNNVFIGDKKNIEENTLNPDYYNNSDRSLVFVSSNENIYKILAGTDSAGISVEDKAEFAELLQGPLKGRLLSGQETYSQYGNTPEQSRPPVPDGPSVAELEAQVNSGQTISLLDLAHAVNRERETTSNRAKPSILAQLHESKRTTAQGEDSGKAAPKRDNEREV